ncbi:MAG: hypothetical protein KC431_25700 [Myxococcales bacterium]|nr:hypothetical protein [Myxococcales bacterium]MCA9700946.1 hypothetical protein [Myxococcales bacterium]
MAVETLAESPDNSIKVVSQTLDVCVGAANGQVGKAQQRMDKIADAAVAVALIQIAKAAGG